GRAHVGARGTECRLALGRPARRADPVVPVSARDPRQQGRRVVALQSARPQGVGPGAGARRRRAPCRSPAPRGRKNDLVKASAASQDWGFPTPRMPLVTPSDWLTVAAIVLAPLVALRVSVWLDRRKEKRQRQFLIFQTLMATRASGLAPEHVQALNMIDVEFYGADQS